MNQNVAGRMVVGLDIGTSKIVAIVGEQYCQQTVVGLQL